MNDLIKAGFCLLIAFYALFAFIILNAWLFAKVFDWLIERDLKNKRLKR